jgi:hypothetical protein
MAYSPEIEVGPLSYEEKLHCFDLAIAAATNPIERAEAEAARDKFESNINEAEECVTRLLAARALDMRAIMSRYLYGDDDASSLYEQLHIASQKRRREEVPGSVGCMFCVSAGLANCEGCLSIPVERLSDGE